jgi:hypothetical protein
VTFTLAPRINKGKNIQNMVHHERVQHYTLNGFQTSDIVHIGLLTRVRGFTYQDNLSIFILNSDLWKNNKFHFCLYFDSFSSNAKGMMIYILMVNVDRPNIELGMKLFQEFFDGDTKKNQI